MGALQLISARQASWSTTANQLKARIDRVRWITFALSILGAILATVASQLEQGGGRREFAIASAIALAIGTFMVARLGAATQIALWTRARNAAEALKREGFKFAAQAKPYDGADAEAVLTRERQAIEASVDELNSELVEARAPGSVPTNPFASPSEYIKQRVEGAVNNFYRPKADAFRSAASRLRNLEFGLALAATILTAVVGVLDKYPVAGLSFDLAALTAVLTTIGGLILAHIEASRYDFLVRTYRAAARQLEDALSTLTTTPAQPSPEWSEFVDRCESIISAENSSWVAKWTAK